MTYRTAAIDSASFTRSNSSTTNRKSNQQNSSYNNNRKINQQGFGTISNFIVLAAVIGMTGLLYLTQITKTSTFSYELETLEQDYSERLKENQSLKIESARLESLDRLENSAVAGSLISPDSSNTKYKSN